MAQKITLAAAFALIPDPRHRQGRRHPLPAILSMTTAALLCGCRGLSAVSEWGRTHLASNHSLFRRFGFTSFTTPAVSTLHEVFKIIDVSRVEQVFQQWVSGLLPRRARTRTISVDGKTLRGTPSGDGEVPGVHLLSAFVQEHGSTLFQQRVDGKTNEAKAALELLERLILEDTVIVGDALFCQREVSAAVLEGGGDYLFVLKDNQPALKRAVVEAFSTPVSPLGAATLAG